MKKLISVVFLAVFLVACGSEMSAQEGDRVSEQIENLPPNESTNDDYKVVWIDMGEKALQCVRHEDEYDYPVLSCNWAAYNGEYK